MVGKQSSKIFGRLINIWHRGRLVMLCDSVLSFNIMILSRCNPLRTCHLFLLIGHQRISFQGIGLLCYLALLLAERACVLGLARLLRFCIFIRNVLDRLHGFWSDLFWFSLQGASRVALRVSGPFNGATCLCRILMLFSLFTRLRTIGRDFLLLAWRWHF